MQSDARPPSQPPDMADPNPPNTLTFPPERRDRIGRWTRRILVVGGILLLVFVGVSFALSRFLQPDILARWVEPRLEAAVNRDVEVERLSVSFLPLGIGLDGLEIADPTGLSSGLARLESMVFRVRLLPLLQRRVEVREIVLEGLVANLRVGADGTTNFGDFSPAEDVAVEADTAQAPPFALQLEGIRIRSGRISYRNVADSQAVLLEDLGGESSVRREADGPWELDGSFTARMTLEAPGLDAEAATDLSEHDHPEASRWLTNVPVEVDLSAQADPDFGSIHVREGTVALEEIRLALTGEVAGLKEPVRQVQLALHASQLPLERLLSLVPDSVMDPEEVEAQGTLSADLALEGPLGPGEMPGVTGTAAVEGGLIRYRGRTLTEDLVATVEIPGGGAVRPHAEGQLLGGGFRVDGTVMTSEPRTADLTVEAAPDLGRIDPDFLPEGVELSGIVPLNLRISGDLAEPGLLQMRGDLGLRQLRAAHPALGVPVSIASADLTLDGTRATLPETVVRLGDDRFQVRGVLSGLLSALDGGVPDFRGSARGPRASLVELAADPPADTALTYGRVAFAKVGDRRVRGVSADAAAREMGLERPATLPAAGELQVAIDTVLDRKGRMEDVRATLRFGPDFLQVSDADFRRYGGRIQTSGNLAFGDESSEPFSFQLVVDGVQAGAFLGETTPLGRAITGTLDLSLDITGGLNRLLLPTREALTGRGRFSLTGGGVDAGAITAELSELLGIPELRSLDVQDWNSTFTLEDGMVSLGEGTLAGAPGSPRVGGDVGLDGGLDLVAAFDLPRQDMAASALERLGVQDAARLVTAVVRIGGTVTDPTLEVDPTATVTAVQDEVQEAAEARIEEEIRDQQRELEERATDFLTGLLRGRRTADTLPRDSAAMPDTLAPDSLQADTLRRDTLPRDTLPRDTLRLFRR